MPFPGNHEVISLSDESDDEPQPKRVQTHAVVDLDSDSTDLEESELEGKPATEELKSEAEPAESSDEEPDVKGLTPREAMRELAAHAAERRRAKALKEVEKEAKKETLDIKSKAVHVEKSINVEKSVNVPKSVPIPKKEPSLPSLTSPIRMISNKAYCDKYCPSGNIDAVTMEDMVGSPLLEKTYQFNFLIDCTFLLPFIKTDPLNVEIILVNSGLDEHLILDSAQKMEYRIRTIPAAKRLPKYGTHHTKMMVNLFHDDTCQIVVHTMNLTPADYSIQTQMCWMSPRLKFAKEDQKKRYLNNDLDLVENTGDIFKRDLVSYIRTYEEPKMEELVEDLEKFDFSPIDVQFVASSPGRYVVKQNPDKYSPEVASTFGYGRLYQWMKLYGLETSQGEMVAQTSTIAGPFDSARSNIFVHLLTSIAEGSSTPKKPDHVFNSGLNPKIMWPTVPEILQAHSSYLSGYALNMHTKPKGTWMAYKLQWDNIRKFFYRWSSPEYSGKNSRVSKAGRSRLSPHVKTYCVTQDEFKTLNWFLMTSANLSSQAWGRPVRKSKNLPEDCFTYQISSYEAGVLINPKTIGKSKRKVGQKTQLIPVFGRDSLPKADIVPDSETLQYPVRLPYDIPLYKYRDTDQPWSAETLEEIVREASGGQ